MAMIAQPSTTEQTSQPSMADLAMSLWSAMKSRTQSDNPDAHNPAVNSALLNFLSAPFTAPGVDALGLSGPIAIPAAVLYHGSPHLFSKFKLSQVGTGQGAQTFGHGLYFADDPKVAVNYARDLWPGRYDQSGRGIAMRLIGDEVAGGSAMTREAALSEMQRRLARSTDPAFARTMHEGIDYLKSGGGAGHYLYQADVPDEAIGRMLMREYPLAQQPANVQEGMRNLLQRHAIPANMSTATGEDLLSMLQPLYSPSALSTAMRGQGIPGLRYLDAISRADSHRIPTFNYVIFDDQIPRILGRQDNLR